MIVRAVAVWVRSVLIGWPRRACRLAVSFTVLMMPRIGRAPAEMAGEHLLDLVVGRVGVLLQERLRHGQPAGGAVAAVGRHVADADLLDRIERVVVAEPFDGQDRLLGRLVREHVARIVRRAVDHHGAHAAGRAVAAAHRAGEPDLFGDHLPERGARLVLDGVLGAVEVEGRRQRRDRLRQRRRRGRARSRARCAGTATTSAGAATVPATMPVATLALMKSLRVNFAMLRVPSALRLRVRPSTASRKNGEPIKPGKVMRSFADLAYTTARSATLIVLPKIFVRIAARCRWQAPLRSGPRER